MSGLTVVQVTIWLAWPSCHDWWFMDWRVCRQIIVCKKTTIWLLGLRNWHQLSESKVTRDLKAGLGLLVWLVVWKLAPTLKLTPAPKLGPTFKSAPELSPTLNWPWIRKLAPALKLALAPNGVLNRMAFWIPRDQFGAIYLPSKTTPIIFTLLSSRLRTAMYFIEKSCSQTPESEWGLVGIELSQPSEMRHNMVRLLPLQYPRCMQRTERVASRTTDIHM